jgi:thiopurine S-methyltransferase
MDPAFWHERWADGRIGFHEGAPNALMVKHFGALDVPPGARVFVPLCGKSFDLIWLRAQGLEVVGAELDLSAVSAFFDENGLAPEVDTSGPLERYHADGIEIFAGDIFELTAAQLGPVNAVYDRAALVALPHDMRARYAQHLPDLTASAPQLVITFDYDQSAANGPPFSVPTEAVATLYAGRYRLTELERVPITGNLAARVSGHEIVSHLTFDNDGENAA